MVFKKAIKKQLKRKLERSLGFLGLIVFLLRCYNCRIG
uniref:Uncharacterized protein n=1 Tax=Vibrio tasmaniensis TaxID=212663 RepID=A0A0H3ZKC5_9VIBR|nr:hypothetical protein [Vibrio tasmaniensis]